MDEKQNFIKEFQYVTGTYPELDIVLSKGKYQHWFACNYTYTVFLELSNRKEIIYVSQSTEKYSEPEIKFIDYVNKLPSVNLNDLIYLCTLYRKLGTENLLFKPYIGRIKFLEEYLKNTYGRLVYARQAIYLVMFYSNNSYEAAKRIIMGLNDWEMNAQARAFTLSTEDGYSFLNLWNEYTFGRRVYESRFEIAKQLQNLIYH